METDLNNLVDSFVSDIKTRICSEAYSAVAAALGSPVQGAPNGHAGRASAARLARAPAAKAAKKGGKRDPGAITKLTERLASHIKSHAGSRIEQIGKAMSVPTKELALPVKKLLAAKRISTKGERRATKYFAK